MSKIYTLFLAFGLIALSPSGIIWAELVQFPVGVAAWTIDVSQSQSRVGKKPPVQGPSSIVKVDVLQGEQYRSSLVTYLSGDTRVNWDIPGTPVILREDLHGTPFLVYKSDFYFVPFLPSDFAWISPGLLQEKTPVSHDGKLCFHYKNDRDEAWIDSKTLLPVALDDGTYLAAFSFKPSPVTPPELPEKFKKIVTAFAATMGIPHSKQGQ